MLPKHRSPTHPGEMLFTEFLQPMALSQVELAARMGVPVQRVNTLVNGKRGITAETAWLLADVLGTSPEFWMNLQTSWDLWHASKARSPCFTQSRWARDWGEGVWKSSRGCKEEESDWKSSGIRDAVLGDERVPFHALEVRHGAPRWIV